MMSCHPSASVRHRTQAKSHHLFGIKSWAERKRWERAGVFEQHLWGLEKANGSSVSAQYLELLWFPSFRATIVISSVCAFRSAQVPVFVTRLLPAVSGLREPPWFGPAHLLASPGAAFHLTAGQLYCILHCFLAPWTQGPLPLPMALQPKYHLLRQVLTTPKLSISWASSISGLSI